MNTNATAQTILTSIQTGKTTQDVVESQMLAMEAAIDRGAEVIGLRCTYDEAREVIRLVRAGLAPAAQDDPPAKIETQAAVTMRHTPQCALLDAMDHTHTMRVTTQHASSSYGQPVVVQPDGALVDYAQIEAIHLLGSSAAEAAQVGHAMAPFGLRITWQARSADPHEDERGAACSPWSGSSPAMSCRSAKTGLQDRAKPGEPTLCA